MASVLNIISLNIRGLRNQVERRAIFSYLKNQNATLYCLQETFSKEKDDKIWSAEWGGQVVFSHDPNTQEALYASESNFYFLV